MEVFYGGAGGGGKTEWLLMEGLRWADTPGFHGVIFRRTHKQLNLPNSILHRCHGWLRGTDAKWHARDGRYVFPSSGATLTFTYLQHDKDVYSYDGPEFSFIGFDELTSFSEFQYTHLFSRLRKPLNAPFPIRARSASNPGGIGHLWVKDRFVSHKKPGKLFVPAFLSDNPSLDAKAYLLALREMDAVSQSQRAEGNWDAEYQNAMFKRAWLCNLLPDAPTMRGTVSCRFWDFASTENGGDWTVGAKVSLVPVEYGSNKKMVVIEDVERGQWSPAQVAKIVKSTAVMDGKRCRIRIEQEPGSAGKHLVETYVKHLQGYDVQGVRASGSKATRWRPLASQAEINNVLMVSAPWNSDLINELTAVSGIKGESATGHDDQADAVSGAYNDLVINPPASVGLARVG